MTTTAAVFAEAADVGLVVVVENAGRVAFVAGIADATAAGWYAVVKLVVPGVGRTLVLVWVATYAAGPAVAVQRAVAVAGCDVVDYVAAGFVAVATAAELAVVADFATAVALAGAGFAAVAVVVRSVVCAVSVAVEEAVVLVATEADVATVAAGSAALAAAAVLELTAC